MLVGFGRNVFFDLSSCHYLREDGWACATAYCVSDWEIGPQLLNRHHLSWLHVNWEISIAAASRRDALPFPKTTSLLKTIVAERELCLETKPVYILVEGAREVGSTAVLRCFLYLIRFQPLLFGWFTFVVRCWASPSYVCSSVYCNRGEETGSRLAGLKSAVSLELLILPLTLWSWAQYKIKYVVCGQLNEQIQYSLSQNKKG